MKKIVLLTFVLSCHAMAAGQANPQRNPQQVGTGGIGKAFQVKAFNFSDISCKGKSSGARPVKTVFIGEISNGKISNVHFTAEKNGSNFHRFSDLRSIATQISKTNAANYIADVSGNDEAYVFQVELPRSGKGRGHVQIFERGTQDILSSAVLTCRTKKDASLREKNELCIAVAKKYAIKDIETEHKDGYLFDEEPEVESNKFTGVYVFAFSPSEECVNSITVRTRLKVLPNKKISCEVYDYEYGEQECG